jgi:type VI secretion system protein ImpH
MTSARDFLPGTQETPDLPQNELGASPVWQRVAAFPQQADLFSLLRWLDCRDTAAPLLGRAARPEFEAVRLGQEPSLAFAPSTIASIAQVRRRPRISIFSFGLFGPNGPLPLHLTEFARDRLRRAGDATLTRFADMFHHRLILLFYRAWADAQPTVSLDRPQTDRFTHYIASLIGYGQPSLLARDRIPDHAKFFNAPHLARQTRNPEGLASILSGYLQVPVGVEEFVPHWMPLAAAEQTRLGDRAANNRLGEDAVLGDSVPDAQHKIRLRLGPMSLARYRSLLPGARAEGKISDWIKNYAGIEFFVDLQLVLRKEEAFPASLGETAQLGWTSWLDVRRGDADADDLVLETGI